MKIHIKNIGMLDEAEFEVGDLTLICGENNTGKTYATYSLYGYLDFMRSIRENMFLRARRNLFDDNEFLENIGESQREIKITYEKILEKLKKHLQEKTRLYSSRILLQIMAGKEEDFSNVEFSAEFSISLADVKEAIEKYLEDSSLNRRHKRRVQHTIYDDGLSFSGLDKRSFVEYAETFFDAMLYITCMKNFILSVERTGASIFQEELDFIKIAKLEKEKDDYESGIEDILEGATSLERELQEIDITYATEKQKLVSVEENIAKIEQRLAKLRQEQETIEEQKKQTIDNKIKIEEEIKTLTEETEKLTKIINEFAELNKDNQKYVDDLNFDITNLKISVSSFDESETSIEEIQERINIDIENTNKSIQNKNIQIEEIKQENFNLQKSIEEIQEKIENIKEEVKNSGTKVENLKQERIDKNAKLAKQEDEITEKFKIIEDLKAQIVKVDVKKTKLEEDIQNIINKMWEEYELTPNAIGEEYKKPENVALTQKKVNSLRKELRELGSVNVDSIEEYKNLKERYDFMCEQRVDLEDTMAKLRKIISDMTTTMKEQFKTQFEIINKNFAEVFKELFGGGNASLKLEDEENILECGIDINVQPPGKKLQNMMLLSGGEKAFTAIALLFAILKINPAPFCVLDEIEAALDDVNVYRFAEYLKKFSENTQFLVITHRKGTMEAADTV